MSTGISFVGLGIIVLGGLAVVVVVSLLFRGRSGGQAPQAAAGVSLTCPHCGQDTDASEARCQHCEKEL